MDILSHTLSGAAVGGAVAALTPKTLPKQMTIMVCGALGAFLPDVDTLTLWSGFDAVIGKYLGLTDSGHAIYFGNHWYSHHNWTHSLMAGLTITLVVGLALYLCSATFSKRVPIAEFKRRKSSYLLAFFIGYAIHLLGDLPTPGHVWRGIKLLWPLSVSIGGTGHIWWWNNYDIFILLVGCCSAIALLLCLQRMVHMTFLRHAPALLVALTILAGSYQILHRPIDFTYNKDHSNHDKNEEQSKAIQKDILGEPVFNIMVDLDRRIPIYF